MEQTIVNCFVEAAFTLAVEGHIGCANPPLAEMTGRTVDEFSGRPPVEVGLLGGERLLKERNVETHWVHASGEMIPVVLREVPIRFESGRRLYVMEQARVGEFAALGEEPARYARPMASMPWEFDPATRTIRFHSPADTTRVPATIHPEDRDEVYSLLERVDQPGRLIRFDCRILSQLGGFRWFRAVGTSVPGIRGIATNGVMVDIQDLKKWEESSRSLGLQLLESQKLEAIGLLTGGIVHDFNNLLMAILGNASLAAMDAVPETPVARALRQIELASMRASELTKELLTYTKKTNREQVPVNVTELVLEMSELLKTAISKRAIIEYQFETNLPQVLADPTRLRQVMMNLITNASDALENREGVISIRTGVFLRRSEIPGGHCYLEDNIPPGPVVYFQVRDTGCGMDPETLRRIFEPFYTTKPKGRGLGLAALQNIVREHKGAIILSSHPGEGTSFTVLLPPAADLPLRSKPNVVPITPPEAGAGRAILVIDDEEVLLHVGRGILERLGFTVLTADDGARGLALYQKHSGQIAAVIVDVMMPGLNGPEVYRRLRALSLSLPILFTSGYHEEETLYPADDRHCGFIQKPYRPADLQGAIQALMES